jgi:hypothetical protein
MQNAWMAMEALQGRGLAVLLPDRVLNSGLPRGGGGGSGAAHVRGTAATSSASWKPRDEYKVRQQCGPPMPLRQDQIMAAAAQQALGHTRAAPHSARRGAAAAAAACRSSSQWASKSCQLPAADAAQNTPSP